MGWIWALDLHQCLGLSIFGPTAENSLDLRLSTGVTTIGKALANSFFPQRGLKSLELVATFNHVEWIQA